MSEPIDLNHAFPEYIEQMEVLCATDPKFEQLYEAYLEIERELYVISAEMETPEDAYVEELKKKRLTLKDEIMAILHSAT